MTMLSSQELQHVAQFVVEKTSEGLLCVDESGHILHANESAARVLAQPPSALLQTDIFHLAPEMVPVLWKELWKEIRANAFFPFEFQLHASAERIVQVDMTAYRLETSGRELACLLFHDIDERKRLQALHQEFVTNVSHELRTPMTVIREGISQVLEGLRGEINETQKRALALALSGIERMGRMIDNLLDMSKIESGKITLKKERHDLCALVREVAGAFQALAEDRGLDLRVTTPAGAVIIYGDRDRLMQVLTNLVGNSVKYTEKGHIQIAVSQREQGVECAVSDTGIGIDSKNLEKAFVKFEQLGQVAFTGEKGTGLGLSISRGIIDLHKGKIWAASEGVGRGSTVTFSLPRQNGQGVFLEQLGSVLHEVSRRGGSLSTVILQLEPLGKKAVDPALLGPTLSNIENIARRQTGRLTDLLIEDESAVYLALQSTVKREAVRVADSIKQAVEKESGRELQKLGYVLTYAIYSFPEEARSEKEFLAKLFPVDA